jgi:aryl-alcohol dehydrogenase-like predicted oxidoreductase
MKIILGAAQFGMDYGISNKLGQTNLKEVGHIIDFAYKNGIRDIDTASIYGNSEKVLGEVFSDANDWKIITKTVSFQDDIITEKQLDILKQSFDDSMNKLKKYQLYGLLVHSCDDLFKPGGSKILKYLEELRLSGSIKRIGVSIYNSYQIDKLLDSFGPDIIQLPINLLDQRLIKSKHLKKIKKYGIEIHARSVFLQGLLLMDLDSLPYYFLPIKENLRKIEVHSKKHSLTKLEFNLSFIRSLREVDKILVGVNTLAQLREIIDATKLQINKDSFSNLSINDQNYLNPSLWKL